MDPFLTSAHKEHFKPSPKYQAVVKSEVDRIMAMPSKERGEFIHDLHVKKSRRETSYEEMLVLKALRFQHATRHRAIVRRRREKIRKRFRRRQDPCPTVVYRGFNTNA